MTKLINSLFGNYGELNVLVDTVVANLCHCISCPLAVYDVKDISIISLRRQLKFPSTDDSLFGTET